MIMTDTTSLTVTTYLVTARQGVTLLPRCLQVLSRRGYIIQNIRTDDNPDGSVTLHITARGPDRWHNAVPDLLNKLTDVTDVRTEGKSDG